MSRALLAVALMLFLGCAEEDVASPHSVGPSPLRTFDIDRLWILLNAKGLATARCKDYYGDDPVLVEGLRRRCEPWEREVVDYLRLNGMPTLEAEHVREDFHPLFLAKSEAISQCHGRIPSTSSENLRLLRACDPWENAIYNDKLTVEDLGIVFPPER